MNNKSFQSLLSKLDNIRNQYTSDVNKIEHFKINKNRLRMISIDFNGDNIKNILMRNSEIIRALINFKDAINRFFEEGKEILKRHEEQRDIHQLNAATKTFWTNVLLIGALLVYMNSDFFEKRFNSVKKIYNGIKSRIKNVYKKHKNEINEEVKIIIEKIKSFVDKLELFVGRFILFYIELERNIEKMYRTVLEYVTDKMIYFLKTMISSVIKHLLKESAPDAIKKYFYKENDVKEMIKKIEEGIIPNISIIRKNMLSMGMTPQDYYRHQRAESYSRWGLTRREVDLNKASLVELLLPTLKTIRQEDNAEMPLLTEAFFYNWNSVGGEVTRLDWLRMKLTFLLSLSGMEEVEATLQLMTYAKSLNLYVNLMYGVSLLDKDDELRYKRHLERLWNIKNSTDIQSVIDRRDNNIVIIYDELLRDYMRMINAVDRMTKIRKLQLRGRDNSEEDEDKNETETDNINRILLLKWFGVVLTLTNNWINEDGTYNFKANFESLSNLMKTFFDSKKGDEMMFMDYPETFKLSLMSGFGFMYKKLKLNYDNIAKYAFSETVYNPTFFLNLSLTQKTSKQDRNKTHKNDEQEYVILLFGEWNLESVKENLATTLENISLELQKRELLNNSVREHEELFFLIFETLSPVNRISDEEIEDKLRYYRALNEEILRRKMAEKLTT